MKRLVNGHPKDKDQSICLESLLFACYTLCWLKMGNYAIEIEEKLDF